MKKRLLFFNPILFLILASSLFSCPFSVRASSLAGERTLVLYDASSGAVPGESLLDFIEFPPGSASVTYSEDATVLDTTPSGNNTVAGWTSGQATTAGFPVLDRTTGMQVNFTLQVESESHARDNRCGLSAIILDQNARGIELCIWENEIWAQNDADTGGLFTHGEGAAFSSASGLTDYQVMMLGDTYTLTANAQPLLSGPIRDYSSFEGFPDPYETPNFLFLGDDTRSGEARIRHRFLSVTGTDPGTVPGISTSQPVASSMPQPTVSPVATPSPTPTGGVPALCSSGWLIVGAAMTGAVLIRKRSR